MHGVKNDPGLIPTERELKLTVKTIEGSDQKEDIKKLSSSVRTKIRSKSLNPKSLNKLICFRKLMAVINPISWCFVQNKK